MKFILCCNGLDVLEDTAYSSLLPCPLPTPTREAEIFSSPAAHSPPWLCSAGGTGGVAAPSLPPWHLDLKIPDDSLSYPLKGVIQQATMEPATPFIFSWFFFFNFSYILNKFPIIEANRCSLAGVLGSAWLQNHFAGAHTRSGRAACQGKDFL